VDSATVSIRTQSSPLAADIDQDGLKDSEEAEGGRHEPTDPWTDDTDGDGFIDSLDLAPSKVWALPWRDTFEPGLLRYSPRYDVYGVRGILASIYTWHYPDTCDFVSDHTASATRNSIDTPDSVVATLNKALEDSDEDDFRAYAAERTGGTSWGTAEYRYGDCDFWHPRQYRILYEHFNHPYEISMKNVRDVTVRDDAGAAFYHATIPVPLILERTQSITLQMSVPPAQDRTASGTGTSTSLGMVYSLYRNSDFQNTEPFYRNMAIGTEVDTNAYQIALRVPPEVALDANTEVSSALTVPTATLVMNPVWVMASATGVTKSAFNATDVRVGAVVLRASDRVEEIVYRLDVDAGALNSLLPGTFGTYLTGDYTFGAFQVYVYNLADGVPFDNSALGRVHATVLTGDAQEEITSLEGQIGWTIATWRIRGEDEFGNVVDLLKKVKKVNGTTKDVFGLYYQVLEARSWARVESLRQTRIAVNVNPYRNFDTGKLTFTISQSRFTANTGMAPDPNVPSVRLRNTGISEEDVDVSEILENLDDSTILGDRAIRSLRTEYQALRALKGAAVFISMAVISGEAVMAWREGDTVRASLFVAAGIFTVWGAVKADVILVNKLGDGLLKGKSLKFGAVAQVAVGFIMVGVSLWEASQATNEISRLSHYEAAAAAGIDTGIALIPIVGLAVSLGWGAGVLLGQGITTLLGWGTNPVADQILSSPGSTIVFLIEYILASNIPSAVSQDALNRILTFLGDTVNYLNSNGTPAILLVPPE